MARENPAWGRERIRGVANRPPNHQEVGAILDRAGRGGHALLVPGIRACWPDPRRHKERAWSK